MTTIQGPGHLPVGFEYADDPATAVDLMLLRESHEHRTAARHERTAAAEDYERELSEQVETMRAAADWRLASGLLQAGTQIAQGGAGLARAGLQGNIARLQYQAKHGGGPSCSREAAVLGAQAQRIEDASSVGQGLAAGARAALDRVATNHDTEGKDHERAAARARERADGAREAAQDASGLAQRAIDRIGQSTQGRAQTASALVGNIRA